MRRHSPHGRKAVGSRSIKRFGVGERELGGMQVVGEGDRGEKKSQDADQSSEALPFPAVRRAGAQLRQPPHAPHE